MASEVRAVRRADLVVPTADQVGLVDPEDLAAMEVLVDTADLMAASAAPVVMVATAGLVVNL